MPSSVPPKKRKYNADKDSPLSDNSIEILSLHSSPASNTSCSSSNSLSSTGGEESTLGSSFSPNIASLVDTQQLSPDFQTQNSFGLEATANNKRSPLQPPDSLANLGASSFTLTRMVPPKKKKQTPRRQSPRHKKAILVDDDFSPESLLQDRSHTPKKAVKVHAEPPPIAKEDTVNSQNNNKEASQGSEKTSKATNASGANKSVDTKQCKEEKVATAKHAQKSSLDIVGPSETINPAVATNKNRPLQDNATKKQSTPPKTKSKTEIKKKTSSKTNSTETTKTPQLDTVGKENVPAPPQEAKKPKKKKLTFQDQVFQHMMFSYKPFSLKSLAQELKTTEAALNFLMLSLIDKNLVLKKEFSSGRNKELYWVNYGTKAKELQTHLATASEMNATQVEHDQLVQEHAQTQRMLAALVGDGPSNEDLSRQLEQAETELQMLQTELNDLKRRIHESQGGVQERCPKRLKMGINYMRDIWRKRREQCNDFIEQLADGMEKKPKEVIKLLELELDGDIQMPPKYKVE